MKQNSEPLIGGIPKSEHVARWRSQFKEMLNVPDANVDGIRRKWLDLPYTNRPDGVALDIYLPEEGPGPFPVILYIHGGGWFLGHKRNVNMEPFLYVLQRGYALVSVDYTLSDKAEFPTQVYEVKTAARWLRENAEKYCLQAEKIALWGDSAGGHLAALAGISSAAGELEDLSFGSPDQSSAVSAVVDWYGPADFFTMREQQKEMGVSMQPAQGCSMEELFLGSLLDDAPDKVKAANPETYISPASPPFFIQHGDKDFVVPCGQSVSLAAKLKEALGEDKVYFEILEGAAHADPCFFRRDNMDKALDFLDKYLK